ncbi:SocA family protein [Corynebacterium lizhenjunii]|uniref:SocA family protein n=1 Tax=Corynebacterium lizhenjunii TaxID=2709394 RepID=A0A7T0KF49_9CORY|nr:Panacea domain-containing protein [Corynebacterium lizhenjunii]QPK79640.1 SocA family protein [Corynebacterium lizhenjunii]
MTAIKTAQALNFFLQRDARDAHSVDGNSCRKLIALLWAADRLSLRSFGHSMTEDQYVALPSGPVASGVRALMEACEHGSSTAPEGCSEADVRWWREHFEARGGVLKCIAEVGSDYLSQADVLILEMAYAKFRGIETSEVSEISRMYPEWTRKFIPGSLAEARGIELADFFANPEDGADPYFQVEQDTLEAASYFFNERRALLASLGLQH